MCACVYLWRVFFVCVCVCVCVCCMRVARFVWLSVCVGVGICRVFSCKLVCACVCVCVARARVCFVCELQGARVRACVCVCVCVVPRAGYAPDSAAPGLLSRSRTSATMSCAAVTMCGKSGRSRVSESQQLSIRAFLRGTARCVCVCV